VEEFLRSQSGLEGDDLAWAQSGHEGSPSWPGAAVRACDRICEILYGGVDAHTSRTSDGNDGLAWFGGIGPLAWGG
jgi:hypothetical protein